jgi:low molecular weight protein-tyrosine phosphatase
VPTRVLFVCMGNICRSPTAEAVMRSLVAERGLDGDVQVDSAGTTGYHAGDRPDSRAVAAAARRGVAVSGRARQVTPADFAQFDLLVAMDEENRRDLLRLAPPGTRHKVRRLADVDVPDPYYGGPRGFEDVLDVVEAGCSALLDELVTGGVRHG